MKGTGRGGRGFLATVEGGGKGLLNIDVVGDVDDGWLLSLPPWLNALEGKELSKPLVGELLIGSLLELGRAVRSMIPSIDSKFVSRVSSSSLGGRGGGILEAFCFPFLFPCRIELVEGGDAEANVENDELV